MQLVMQVPGFNVRKVYCFRYIQPLIISEITMIMTYINARTLLTSVIYFLRFEVL